MAYTIYSNCTGTYAFSDKKQVDQILFTKADTLKYGPLLEKQEQIEPETQMLSKYSGAQIVGKKQVPPAWILEAFTNMQHITELRERAMLVTKRKIATSVNKDNLIIQASNNIDEIDKVANNMSERLREWYELYNPEFSKSIESDEKFAELIQKQSKQDLLKEIGMTEAESMGAEIAPLDMGPVMDLAASISALYALRTRHSEYVQNSMQELMPNVTALAGAMIGAKLLAIAGSSEKLALFPASTIQLLGAEKALFRHIKTGSRPPKFGVIINHPYVAKARPAEKGKVARMLADKLSIASKIDFFKGNFRGEQLKRELEEKLKLIIAK